MAPKRQPDQSAPKTVSPTGVTYEGPKEGRDPRAQAGEFLTSAQGVRLPDTDHSLKAGRRGPVLLEDFHLREKIMHFDHERIPERVVHARGAGAHGVFTAYGSAAGVTRAAVLAEKGLETPVFVRFSTVLGSRGSADTVRDTRGFATKFYTKEGTWDLVGNNMPVFFIQDAHQVPGHHPRGQAAPRPGDPAGAVGARHLLGLRHPAHRGHPPHDLEHERPGHPALATGRWRASASTPSGWSTPSGETVAGQVPLEAQARRALPHLGGGADRRRRRPGLPPPRPLRRHRGRRVPRVGARHPGDAGHRGRDLRGHRPARPDQDRARGAVPGAADREAGAQRQPDELLRRDRAGRLPHRAPRARASRPPTTRCCRAATSPTSTPS